MRFVYCADKNSEETNLIARGAGGHGWLTMAIDIKHIVTIGCTANIVYSALTTLQGIRGWWTPDTVIEPTIGTVAEFIFGDKYHNKMEITDLQANRRVEWQCIQGDSEWVGTNITFDLEDTNGQTTLRFGQNNWKELTDFYAHCNIQWGQYMVSLKNYCETGTGNPFNPQNHKKGKTNAT